MIHVAVGIVINNRKEILVAERQSHKYQGGRWEFPGGKVEQSEKPLHALQRELEEEIGIQVIAADPINQYKHTYPDRTILLDFWKVTQYKGEAHGKEGQKILWVNLENLIKLEIPDANWPIIFYLQQSLEKNDGRNF